jgi:hypothetical protein
MNRDEKWVEKLDALLFERREWPFAWGSHDCALFACDAILAMTGVDLAADFRGKYSSEATAAEAMQAFCGKQGATIEDVAEKVCAQHGLEELEHPLLARRGDVVIFDSDRWGATLGIVALDGRHVVGAGTFGLERVPITKIERAWRV